MTIFTVYDSPDEFPVTDEQRYQFTFPAADDGAVEVYEMIKDADGVVVGRSLVDVGDYFLSWGDERPRYPLKESGTVQFTRPHGDNVSSVRVYRNTLIDQTLDFPEVRGNYNGRMIEFALDKATMICQEISTRKCNAVVATPMTQEIVFSSYDDFKPSVIQFAVQKIYTILQEIADSVDDCSATPEDT